MVDEELRWLNPPPYCAVEARRIEISTGESGEFWRNTLYGLNRDGGHFLHRCVRGDFTADVHVNATLAGLYDQAGLMARSGGSHWLKCGIEYSEGIRTFSVVAANDHADWALVDIPVPHDGVRLRLTRRGETVRMYCHDPLLNCWKLTRSAYFPSAPGIDVGVVACSPQRSGFRAVFEEFAIGGPIATALHS
jgi:regulation of enolase protein 1 (concanavalin A-like superfamily)